MWENMVQQPEAKTILDWFKNRFHKILVQCCSETKMTENCSGSPLNENIKMHAKIRFNPTIKTIE